MARIGRPRHVYLVRARTFKGVDEFLVDLNFCGRQFSEGRAPLSRERDRKAYISRGEGFVMTGRLIAGPEYCKDFSIGMDFGEVLLVQKVMPMNIPLYINMPWHSRIFNKLLSGF